MAFEVRERLPLARFIYDRDWTPVWGAYLYPLRFFGPERSNEPNDYLQVARVVSVHGRNIAITRGGGLFVRTREEERTEAAVDTVFTVLNCLLCEFALEGLVSAPITDTDVQDGKLIGRHASITGGWGDYGDRTWGPYALLTSGVRDMAEGYAVSRNPWWAVNFYWTPYDPAVLQRIDGAHRSERLMEVSDTLPLLVVAAVFHSSRHNIPETVISAWIVCEELLANLWKKHLSSVTRADRRRRLEDSRTYTASVQAEVLLTAGLIDEEIYATVQDARRIRNNLAHGSAVNQNGAAVAMRGLKLMLNLFGASSEHLPGFSFVGGGIGHPQTALEPEFPFE